MSKEMKDTGCDLLTYGLVFETSGKSIDLYKDKQYFDDYLVTTRISEV